MKVNADSAGYSICLFPVQGTAGLARRRLRPEPDARAFASAGDPANQSTARCASPGCDCGSLTLALDRAVKRGGLDGIGMASNRDARKGEDEFAFTA